MNTYFRRAEGYPSGSLFTPPPYETSASAGVRVVLKRITFMLSILSTGLALFAQTNTWTGGPNGFWSTAGSWSLGVVPTADHDVVIPNGDQIPPSGPTIFITSNAVCRSLTLQGGPGDIALVFSGPVSLNVTDSILIHSGTGVGSAGDDRTIAVSTGSLTCRVLQMDSTSIDGLENKVTASSGSITVLEDIIMYDNQTRNQIAFSGAGVLHIGGLITGGGLVAATSTVNYNGNTAQAIANYPYNNLTVSGDGPKSLSEDCVIAGNLLIDTEAVLSLGEFDLTINSNANRSATIYGMLNINGDGRLLELQGGTKTLVAGSAGIIHLTDNGGSTLPQFDAYDLHVSSTVIYGSTDAQIIEDAAIYGNLSTAAGGSKTFEGVGGSVTVAGDLTIAAGTTLVSNDKTIHLGGDWINHGVFTQGGSTVVFDGTTQQSIGGSVATTFSSLTINQTGSGVLLNLNTTVSSILTLNNGFVITGDNTLFMSSSSQSVITGGSGAAYVLGNLRRAIASGPNTYVFPIGSTGGYAPVTINFQPGTNSGSLTGATYDGDHPNIGNSILYEPSSVNRYWIFAVQTGMASANFNMTLNWNADDEDTSFDHLTSQAGKFGMGSWSYPQIGMRTSSSIEIVGQSGFSDYQVSSCSDPVFTDHPEDLMVCETEMAIFSASASGPGTITYQWFKSGVGMLSDGGNISGSGTNVLTINPVTPADAGNYSVVVTRECEADLTSSMAALVVLNAVDSGTLAAGDQTLCFASNPSNIFFADLPSGGTGTFTYQWYYQDGIVPCPSGTGTAGWTVIATATNSNYDPPAGLTVSRTYAVQVDATGDPDCAGPGWAEGCRQVFINQVDAGTIQNDQTICSGGDPMPFTEVTMASGSGTLTYQWQSSTTDCINGFSDIPLATNTLYDPPPGLTTTTYYRRRVISELNMVECADVSNCISVIVNDVDPGTVGTDQTICSGGDPEAFEVLTPATGSGILSYQWQKSMIDCASGFTDIALATNATYDIPAGLEVSTYYRRVVISTLNGVACSAAGNCIAVFINSVNSGTIEGDQTICMDGDAEEFQIGLDATGAGTLTYQWQSSTSGCTEDFMDIPMATSATYDPPAGLMDTTYFRRRVTSTLNGNSCSALSNCLTVLINEINSGTIGMDQTICPGGDPDLILELTPAVGSGELSYRWQSSTTGCEGSFSDIVFATDITYDPPSGLTDITYYRRIATSTLNGVTCSMASHCMTVWINDVSGGMISADQTICEGGDPETIVEAAPSVGSGTLSYQWQSSTTGCEGSFIDITTASDLTYDPPFGLTETTFYRRVTTSELNGLECSAFSNCVTVFVNHVQAGTVEGDQTICSGGDPQVLSFGEMPTGSGVLTYQWQSSTTGCDGSFADITLATDISYDPPAGLTDTTYYRRIVTSTLNDTSCEAVTNCVTVIVNNISGGVAGSDQTICAGGDPALLLEIIPANGSGDISYQWQSSGIDCVEGFTDIPMATNATYDPPAGMTDTTYFRRVTTSTLDGVACPALSNCTTIFVNHVAGGEIGMDQTICTGGAPAEIQIVVPATGSGELTYQWQSSSTGCATDYTDIAQATDATYHPPAGLTTTTYFRRVTTSTLDSVTCPALSNCVTIFINDVSGGEITNDQTICEGGDPDVLSTLVAATGSGALSYQWQSSTSGCTSDFHDIALATDEMYDPPAGLTETTFYRRITTSALNGVSCSAMSNCVTVLVNTVSSGVIAGDQTICAGGDPAGFSVSVPAMGSGVLTYQWQSSVNHCSEGFSDIPMATDEVYDPPAGIPDTMYYRRIVTSTLNQIQCSDTGNCITIVVNHVDGGEIAADQTICYGGDPMELVVVTSATASGEVSYQWQESITDCNSGFTDIVMATDATYDPSGGLTMTTFYRRQVTSTLDDVECFDFSNCISVLVLDATDPGMLEDGDDTICAGGDPEEIAFTLAPSGGSGEFTYQWYYKDGLVACLEGSDTAGWELIPSATMAAYDPPSGLNISRTFAVMVDATGMADCAPPIWAAHCRKIAVYDSVVLSGPISGPDTIMLCDGGNPLIIEVEGVTGGDGKYTYQWEQSEGCSGVWENAVAEDMRTDTLTFDPPAFVLPLNALCYRLRITDGCDRIGYSEVKTFIVLEDPTSPDIDPSPPSGTTVCLGEALSAIIHPGGGGTGMITDTYEYSVDSGMTWLPYIPGDPIVATEAMIGENTIQIRTQRLATGTGCDDGTYKIVMWSVDPVSPEILGCPVPRNLTGCDLTVISNPVYSGVLTETDYEEFSNSTNQGEAMDACGITKVFYQDTAIGSCPQVVTRTWSLQDSAGNMTSCEQVITITTPPVLISCPPDVVQVSCQMQEEIDSAFNDWISEWIVAVSGGCDPQVVFEVNNVPVTPEELIAPDHCTGGMTTVVINYTDQCESAEHICTTSFVVNAAPEVDVFCPADVLLGSCSSQNSIDSAFDLWILEMQSAISGGCSPIVTYQVDGKDTMLQELAAPGSCTGGVVTIVMSYTDLCDSQENACTSSFEVLAAPPVSINCPADIKIPSCSTQEDVDQAFELWRMGLLTSVEEGCFPDITYEADGIPVALEALIAPDHCEGGSVTVVVHFTDNCENGSCTSSFSVESAPPLIVNCPEDTILPGCLSQSEIDNAFSIWVSALENSISGGCTPVRVYVINGDTMATLDEVNAPDACTGGIVEIEGVYADLCEAGSCSSVFAVPADSPPELINTPGDQVYSVLTTGCQRTIPILKPDAPDDCDPNPEISIVSDNPEVIFFDIGDYWQADFPLGVTLLTITGTDDCGMVTEHEFLITVEDQIAPVMTGCPADIVKSSEPDICGSEVYWTAPTASDNCPGVLLEASHVPGDFFEIGVTNVIYIATDGSGLKDTCTFQITVNDNTPPAILCDTLQPIHLTPNIPPDCTNDTDVPVPVAYDNCDGLIVANGIRSDGRPLNDPWFEGTTVTIAWVFLDVAGNQSICFQDVIVAACTWPSPFIYVDSSKTNGNGNGVDWANALLRIEDALALAAQYPTIQQIWVAEGTYRPTSGSNRNSSFNLLSHVSILGGFAGVVEDISDRDIEQYPTILSGDIGIFNNNTDNCYHVVTVGASVENAVLDGVVIRLGYANGPNTAWRTGGGIRCTGKVRLVNCIIQDNYAADTGAALSIEGPDAEIELTGCEIIDNLSGDGRHVIIKNNANLIIHGLNSIHE